MREFVFPDPSLTSRAGQFVWLAINIEDEKNAPFLVKFPGEAVPTFAVVDPKDESVALRLVGSMTVPQLHAFLDNARTAVAGGGRHRGPGLCAGPEGRRAGQGAARGGPGGGAAADRGRSQGRGGRRRRVGCLWLAAGGPPRGQGRGGRAPHGGAVGRLSGGGGG